jgi:Tfp pilus assembly protein PilO
MSLTRMYIGACLIAIAGMLFWLLVMPLYDTMTEQKDALAERSQLLENRNSILANISALTQQYAANADDIKRFASIVPAQKSVPELVSSLQALANQNGLTITGLGLSSGSSPTEDQSYQSQPIDLGVTGSYLSFKSFLAAMEHNLRIIDISSIDANPTSENSPVINFRLKGIAYFLKP